MEFMISRVDGCHNQGCDLFGCEALAHLREQVKFWGTDTEMTLEEALGFVARFEKLNCPNVEKARMFARDNFRPRQE